MASSRGNPSVADMARTMVILAIFMLGVAGIYWFFTVEPDHPVPEAEYLVAAQGVENQAGFVPLVPQVPDDWRVTSARFDANSWYIGIVTADDEFVSVEQANIDEPPSPPDGVQVADVTLGNQLWTRWIDDDGEFVLFRMEEATSVTVMSTGTLDHGELVASSLEPFSASEDD